jgi:hypothetical protein
MGMGNLADELDQLDDEYEYEEDIGDTVPMRTEGGPDESTIEGARDSGIDVSFPPTSQNSPSRPRNFSKPLVQEDKPPDAVDADEEDRFSPDLEDLVATIARMTAYTTTTEDPLIPRTTALLHDLGPQSNLEAGIQRFTTATNSMTAYATAQTKSLQVLTQSLFSPLFFSSGGNGAYAFDAELVDETVPLIDALLQEIPGGTSTNPSATSTQSQSQSRPPSSSSSDQSLVTTSLSRLSRDTVDVLAALSTLTDTLQMGKQITTTAARHLRTTQAMVAELLRERDRAEDARGELLAGGWNERIQERSCGKECRGIVEGFREVCEGLGREREEAAVVVVAAVS